MDGCRCSLGLASVCFVCIWIGAKRKIRWQFGNSNLIFEGCVAVGGVSVLAAEDAITDTELIRMNAVATLGGWLHLPLNPLRMQKLTENYVSSNAKIKMALGIDRFPIDAREGLRETIEWF